MKTFRVCISKPTRDIWITKHAPDEKTVRAITRIDGRRGEYIKEIKELKMLVQDKHTPLPWSILNEKIPTLIVIGNKEYPQVCVVRYSSNPLGKKEIGEANAEFILRACNSYGELVCVLVQVRDLLVKENQFPETIIISMIDKVIAKVKV